VMKLNDKHGMNKRSLAEEADKFTLVWDELWTLK
jgi:hypothetical protein